MAYADVDTILLATRAAGDKIGRIQIALLKQAVTRSTVISNASDQRERSICRTIIDGPIPTAWVTIILELLDLSGQLSGATDAQIDTQVASGWGYILGSR
jgi:hypothetical protein